MSQNYKETLNLPKTDFPMKANLATREPEMLKVWEETRLYEQIQKARADAPTVCSARWPALRQRRCAHGHRAQQDSQGSGCEIQNHGRISRAVCAGMGLSRLADRIQGGEGIARAFTARSAQEIGSVCAQVHRHPARAIQTARRPRRLGTSVSDDGSRVRSGNLARFRRLCRKRSGL